MSEMNRSSLLLFALRGLKHLVLISEAIACQLVFTVSILKHLGRYNISTLEESRQEFPLIKLRYEGLCI